MSSATKAKDLGDRVVSFLRLRHPQKTAANVAANSHLTEARVKAWLESRSVPDGTAMLRLIAAYGPDFLNAVMQERIGWLDDAVMAERENALRTEIEERQQQLADLHKRL